MNRPLRILNLIRSLDPAGGGVAEGLRQSIAATTALGHLEEVLTLDAPDAPWLVGAGAFDVPVHALGPVASNYGHCAALLPWLKARATHYDAVVVHGLWQYHGLAVWRALRGTAVPYFVFCHGMLDPWFKRRYPLKHLKKWLYWPWAEYRVLRDARAVLFTARDEMRLAAQSFWLYRVRPSVVGYGLWPALQDREGPELAEAFLQAHPEAQGKRVLLFLARLHPKKGCDLLIEAFARIARRDLALHLVMAGPDQVGWQAELQAQAQRLGVADRISWPGMLQGDLKWGALHAAEAFVLPSHQENFGISVAEALSVGVPVLISERINIWREIVEAGAGFAAEDSVEGTLATLERWLALPGPARAQMPWRARHCFAQHFHMDAVARRLIDTIRPHVARRSDLSAARFR
ncbi:MAG: glycosyltransferase [Leptothrix sp. (in: b-proteobacteria)]